MTKVDKNNLIDVSLLHGLELAMTVEEQKIVTKLLTSGDDKSLAQAAEILAGIADLLGAGVVPSNRTEKHTESIRSLCGNIDYTKTEDYAEKVVKNRAQLKAKLDEKDSYSKQVAERAEIAKAEAKEAATSLPLPVRMPRAVTIKVFNTEGELRVLKKTHKKPVLTFLDDEWDGTVMDAYTKIKIGPKGPVRGIIKKVTLRDKDHEIHKEKLETPGVLRILNTTEQGIAYKISDPMSRVLIHETHHEAGKVNLGRGDVVTHINGKPMMGQNVDTVITMINNLREENSEAELDIVVNADMGIAEALKLRKFAAL